MIEIRIHGRGGQGVKKSSMILGRAAFLAKNKTQDFALYGAERRGAPVVSFVRFDKNKINTRGYVFKPDYILILDDTLNFDQITKGATPNTKIIISTNKKLSHLEHFYSVNATKISLDTIGTSLGSNVALLGALIRLMKEVKLKDLFDAIKIELEKYPKELINKNIKAAEICYKEVKLN